MAKATIATVSARVDALESLVLAQIEAIEALRALVVAQAVTYTDAPAAPAVATVAKAPRATECECGRVFKRGRLVSEIAESPLGLCGLKGLSAHSA